MTLILDIMIVTEREWIYFLNPNLCSVISLYRRTPTLFIGLQISSLFLPTSEAR